MIDSSTEVPQDKSPAPIPPKNLTQIPLSNGKVCLIDSEDLELVTSKIHYPYQKNKSLIWREKTDKDGMSYAITMVRIKKNRWEMLRMHRLILGLKKGDGLTGDHRNGNGLDNRRSNLRICTIGENSKNKFKKKGTSKFKGVCLKAGDDKWSAQIGYEMKQVYLGRFDSEIEAAKVYNKKAQELFGEYARLNII